MDIVTPNEAAKKQFILSFLHERVFDPILNSPTASKSLKNGIRLTINRLSGRTSSGIVHFVWSALQGTDKSVTFARKMREEGFTRFEEHIEDFRNTFNDRWMRS